MPKYICTWSGGKDSTATIILAHIHNEPLDLILMSEVMFDNKNNISGENPEHIKWVREYAKPLFESWGYQVEIIRAQKDYLDLFNHVIERPRKHLEHKGKRIGFPIAKRCTARRDLKIAPIDKFLKQYANGDYIKYVGIASDEKKRLESLNKSGSISLLEKYNCTEEDARNMCESMGLLSPSYKYTKRNGCWFCPNAKLSEFRAFRNYDQETWNKFIALENEDGIAFDKFDPIKKVKLIDIERKLADEQLQEDCLL